MFRGRHRKLALRSAVVATIGVVGSLAAAGSTAAGVLDDKLRGTRAEGRQVKTELSRLEVRQQRLVREVSTLNQQIADLRGPIADLESGIERVEYRIERRHARIAELKAEYREQARVIVRLDRELASARDLLRTRVVAAYMSGNTGMMEQIAASGSLEELFLRQEALDAVVGLDERIIDRISSAERAIRVKRSQNHTRRRQVRDDIAQLESDKAEIEQQRSTLLDKQRRIETATADRDALLAKINARENQLGRRLDDLEDDAKLLQEAIANGQTTMVGKPGALGGGQMVWPVNGFVASPFGPRWGRMHEGLDLAVPAGTPIVAAAGGVVIHAGWMGGYGNQVVIQHGGGLTTSYAHQSQVASNVGQAVSQGQVIGYVGCTGTCYGDHTHFETRVNGVAEDPMRYL
jgi:murein DD-endopeptidase MepM/ murein hydrolase activator NlpD